jgi:hypothetical protein
MDCFPWLLLLSNASALVTSILQESKPINPFKIGIVHLLQNKNNVEKNRGPFNSFEVNNLLFINISKDLVYFMDHRINFKK